MRIVIAGGGIGGLALGQALAHRGIDFVVFERDRWASDAAGYRLHLNGDAMAAMRSGLDPEVVAALRASGAGNESFGQFSVLDRHGRTRLRIPDAAAADVLLIGRRPLREVLAQGVSGRVRWGVRATGYDVHEHGVTVHTDVAGDLEADALVAADGTRSVIARQLLGRPTARPAGVTAIAGRVPLDDTTRPFVPADLFEGPGFVIGPNGVGAFLTVHDPQPHTPPVAGEVLESPYLVWSLAAELPRFAANPLDFTAPELLQEALRLTTGWWAGLRGLIEATDVTGIAAFPFWFPAALDRWTNARVTAIGDAVHPMPPTAGAGASTAIVDAIILADELAEHPVPVALRRYQERMLRYAPHAVDEARPPLAWQRALSNPMLRIAGTRVALPAFDAALRARDSLRARLATSRS